jgi:hypothetical protein
MGNDPTVPSLDHLFAPCQSCARLLRAVPVTLGLIQNQFAELLAGDLAEDDELVIGTETTTAPR